MTPFFLGTTMVWCSSAWPFVHVRRGREVLPEDNPDDCPECKKAKTGKHSVYCQSDGEVS